MVSNTNIVITTTIKRIQECCNTFCTNEYRLVVHCLLILFNPLFTHLYACVGC
jgi:hypothetical protein